MTKNYFRSERADAGVKNRLGDSFESIDDVTAGPVDYSGLMTPIAEYALLKYDSRIKAFFRRAGIELGDDVLTVEAIRVKVAAASGLEIATLTLGGIVAALDARLAREMSEVLGFEVTSVLDGESFKAQVKGHVLARLSDGYGGGVIEGKTLHSLRAVATFARAGVDPLERQKVLDRVYQKRYRRKHKMVWV